MFGQSSTRKKKILTDPERMWTKCPVCQEPGNLENMLRKPLPIKNEQGIELYQSFHYIYFCGENCKGLFV